ncbi:hypothetical protein HDK77DRAFT_458809 [Phyllosticta capitalensis]
MYFCLSQIVLSLSVCPRVAQVMVFHLTKEPHCGSWVPTSFVFLLGLNGLILDSGSTFRALSTFSIVVLAIFTTELDMFQ